jgi:DNA-binding transcriptional regulator LsrR (DeoR family)
MRLTKAEKKERAEKIRKLYEDEGVNFEGISRRIGLDKSYVGKLLRELKNGKFDD